MYQLVHTWNLPDGTSGRYELHIESYDEAMARFEDLRLLIENDDYDFDVVIPDGATIENGNASYKVYDRNHIAFFQNLVLTKEVFNNVGL